VNKTHIAANDNWKTTQVGGIIPSNQTIPPGQYTGQVRGRNNASGIGVVQGYFLQ
jgi:hypothetical protein